MSDPVRSPTFGQCCGAAAGFIWGLVQPRRPDQRFMRSIVDAGLPEPRGAVKVTALPQVPRSVPTAYDLDGPPVLTFSRSHDLFGDNSVILVDLAGHTPGSVGVLTHTASGWVLIAGDAAWHELQIEKIRQKSSYPGAFADENRNETFRTLHRLHLARHTVTIIPTHDHQAALQLPA